MEEILETSGNNSSEVKTPVSKLTIKVKQVPKRVNSIADGTIGSVIATNNDDITSIVDSTTLCNEEKVVKLRDFCTIKNAKLKTIKQPAAIQRHLDLITEAMQYITLLSDGVATDDEDEEEMDIFQVIEYNATLVALKKSNALIVTGDAGVGKTYSIKQAIAFLNPIKESSIVDEVEDEVEDTEETEEGTEAEEGTPFEEEVCWSHEETEQKECPEIPTEISEPEEAPIEAPIEVKGRKIIIKKAPPAKTGFKIVKPNVESRNNIESGYYIASGTCTAAALYELLWIHRKKLLIFDDFDSVLKDDDCINLLKAALDTYPIRELSKMTKGNSFNSFGMTDSEMWDEYEITQKVPNQFQFSGNIIFISNIHEDKFDKSLISRALHVEVRLSKKQMIERMHKLMVDIRPEVQIDWKLEALHHLEFLTANYICKFELNLRELIHFIDIKKGFPHETIVLNGKEVPIWKQLAKKRIVKQKIRR